MLTRFITLVSLINFISSVDIHPGIETKVNDGVQSVDYKYIYGDEDLTVINQVLRDAEKSSLLKSRLNLKEALPPLAAQDVKCLMSVDRYCSKKMAETKGILIQALKEDCVKCTMVQKESAGKVAASMMAHDPVAWKLFLTRSALSMLPTRKKKPVKKLGKKESKFNLQGEAEDLISSNRFLLPGFKVRVKRFTEK